jgi:hypothetical protein
MITNEPESFFLTNEQEAKAADRQSKQKRLQHAGEPLKLSGKALDVAIGTFGVFVAESSFVIEQIDLSVNLKYGFIGIEKGCGQNIQGPSRAGIFCGSAPYETHSLLRIMG